MDENKRKIDLGAKYLRLNDKSGIILPNAMPDSIELKVTYFHSFPVGKSRSRWWVVLVTIALVVILRAAFMVLVTDLVIGELVRVMKKPYGRVYDSISRLRMGRGSNPS